MKEVSIESYIEDIVYKCVKKALDNAGSHLGNPMVEEDPLLTIEALIKYLPEKPARQTVYGWVNSRNIPFVKHGKRLYFRKSQIDFWLMNGRKCIPNSTK